jgi:hypothetical protein
MITDTFTSVWYIEQWNGKYLKLSLITENATEMVSQFLKLLKSIDKSVFLNTAER